MGAASLVRGGCRCVGLILFLLAAAAGAQPAGNAGRLAFRTEAVVDRQQGGLVLATLALPAQWRLQSQVLWNYNDVSQPLRVFARAESPDGSAWVEFFPIEVFYWLDPPLMQQPFGARSLGMIYAPHITVRQAVQQFVIGPYRGRNPGLQVVEVAPVDAARLASAFGHPPSPGEALRVRLRYIRNGQPADEDVFAMVGAGNRVPYTGPQGTTYESHRPLVYAHALGATNGQLQSVYPLLAYIAMSIRIDPAWEAHRQKVQAQLDAAFQAASQRGYDQIAAAGAASRQISANNDSMLASMQATRQAQAQRDAAARAANAAGPAATPSRSTCAARSA